MLLRKTKWIARLAIVSAAIAVTDVTAAVVVGKMFSDGMVLQRDQSISIWGRADAGEKVTVRFCAEVASSNADANGSWLITLPALGVRSAASDLVVEGTNRIVIRDVVVGDVWLCGGQSNMELRVRSALNAQNEIQRAQYSAIRLIKLDHRLALTPQDEVEGVTGWRLASPATVAEFSATAYFFARTVHLETGVPIGLIDCSWSGTSIEPWLSEAVLNRPEFAIVGKRWQEALAAYPERRAKFDEVLAEWEEQERKAKANGDEALRNFQKQNRRPRPPIGAPDHPYASQPAGIFNAMIHPLRRLSFRGMLWYQGEANAVRAEEYSALFHAFIGDMRRIFEKEQMPFFWVQIANYNVKTAWPVLREAQASALSLPGTGQAVTIDIGDHYDIHPANKQEVGRRLALIALAKLDGLPVEYSGPVVTDAVVDKHGIRVMFSHAAGLHTRGGACQSLELAGVDGVFHPAEGRIEGESLIVSSAEVPDPRQVRYAWSCSPHANLYNIALLPAAPFRAEVR